jgi:5'-nucleotidase
VPVRAQRLLLTALLAAAPALGAACGDDGDSGAGDGGADGGGDDATTSTTAPAVEPLLILVTNDDGIAAEGIAVLVDALATLPDVELEVVAPAEQQSGTGGSTTEGELTATDAETASGVEAVAVDGFPADSVRYAFDELGIEPDLVVSGINEGQNLGPVVEISGTVGAARAAVARGVPALAASAGDGEAPDYEAVAEVVLEWITENRGSLEADPEVVVNVNGPTCAVGEVRGTLETVTAADLAGRNPIAADIDCTVPEGEPADDIDGFMAGYVVIAPVGLAPAG